MSTTQKTGQERFHRAGRSLDVQLHDFWRWSTSELLSNTLRGRLAEYLVAVDLGIADGIRAEWDAFDLEAPGGISVEVKSGAYLQAWKQQRPSAISFGIAPTIAWDSSTGQYDAARKRQAKVYVFAVLGEKDQSEVDPMDVTQWYFYVLPTKVLNRRLGEQKTLRLGSLLRLEPEAVGYGEIKPAVERAGKVK